MSRYTQFTDKNGTKRYRKDGRLFSPKAIPANVLQVLDNNSEFDEEAIENQPSKECLFCGVYGKYPKLINGQTIALCEEHYYSENIGKIAQKLRENDNEEISTKDD